jgi:hypothetical protein
MSGRRLPAAHHGCRQHLKDSAAKQGLDVTVSTLRPLVAGPYTTDPFVCPHGVTYWIEPTGEQITGWIKEGTP